MSMPLKYDNSACDTQYFNEAIIYHFNNFFAIILVPFLFILDLLLMFCLFYYMTVESRQ